MRWYRARLVPRPRRAWGDIFAASSIGSEGAAWGRVAAETEGEGNVVESEERGAAGVSSLRATTSIVSTATAVGAEPSSPAGVGGHSTGSARAGAAAHSADRRVQGPCSQ